MSDNENLTRNILVGESLRKKIEANRSEIDKTVKEELDAQDAWDRSPEGILAKKQYDKRNSDEETARAADKAERVKNSKTNDGHLVLRRGKLIEVGR